MLSVIYHCFVSQDSDQTGESGNKKNQQPTYFEPGCCYRTLSVALIQRDDGDDVLRVRLQAGEGVHLAVAGQLHRLYFTTFFPIIKTETIDRRADASKAQTVTGLPAHL